MSKPALFSGYQHLLDAICADAMTVVRRVAAELDASNLGTSPLSTGEVTRTVAWITAVVCRAVAVSQHLAAADAPAEERANAIRPAIDSVLARFAAAPLDHAAYRRAVDAELLGETDSPTDWNRFDGHFAEAEPASIRTIPHRPPATLLAELCRDLGMILRAVPPAWLTTLSPELRTFCDGAATAAFHPKAANPGHLMER